VVSVSVPVIVGFAVVTTVAGGVTATVVFAGVKVAIVVTTVVCGVGTVVCVVVRLVCDKGIVVCVVAMVVCEVVTLSALTGSTIKSIARNTATDMTDDTVPRVIDKIPDGWIYRLFFITVTLLCRVIKPFYREAGFGPGNCRKNPCIVTFTVIIHIAQELLTRRASGKFLLFAPTIFIEYRRPPHSRLPCPPAIPGPATDP
jgi:hypothetical protein